MKTITLAMIVKDEYEAVKDLAKQAESHVDAVHITCTHKPSLKKFKLLEKKVKNCTVDYFEWVNRFDEARNHNMKGVKTTHFLWIDADDRFPFVMMNQIRQALEEYEVIWLPYHYDHDENGNVVVEHWRERVIPMDKGFTWRGWIHENCLTNQKFTSKRLNIPVVHQSDHKKESVARNHQILVEAYQATNDPRYVHYLGLSYFTQEKWQEAIDIFKEYVQVGGWDEEIYRSLIKMSEAAVQLGKFDDGVQYALQAAGLLPEYPQAFYQLADICFKQEDWKNTLEWLKVAMRKPQPETASIVDPTVPDKARLMGAISEYKMGNAREATELIKDVTTVDTGDLPELFEYEASLQRVALALPALKIHYKDPNLLWDNLHDEIKFDNRFRKFREQVTEPKAWPKKSVVFFCGKAFEEWGPHTLDKGMGGSEEAIVYLSAELAQLGYYVVVYGELSKTIRDKGVNWRPWTHIDKRDTFDTLVIWRYPQFVPQFKANKILVDMHDLLPKKVVIDYPNTTYLFKSKWQAEQYDVKNFKVIPNGILLEQFKEEEDGKA